MREFLAWLGKNEDRTAVYRHVNEDSRRVFNDARTKIGHFATAPKEAIVQFSELTSHALSYLLISKPPSRLKRDFEKLSRFYV